MKTTILRVGIASLALGLAACGTSQAVKDEQLIKELEEELGPEKPAAETPDAPEAPAKDG